MSTTRKAAPRRVFRLSEHEAQVLEVIFSNIGGTPAVRSHQGGRYPNVSSRATVDAMSARLRRTFGSLRGIAHEGSIYFNDSLEETLANGTR